MIYLIRITVCLGEAVEPLKTGGDSSETEQQNSTYWLNDDIDTLRTACKSVIGRNNKLIKIIRQPGFKLNSEFISYLKTELEMQNQTLRGTETTLTEFKRTVDEDCPRKSDEHDVEKYPSLAAHSKSSDNDYNDGYIMDKCITVCLGEAVESLKTGGDSSETEQQTTIARDDPPASSTASSTAAAMRGKVGSEFET